METAQFQAISLEREAGSGKLEADEQQVLASVSMKTWLVLLVATSASVVVRSSQESVPREWIDSDTGHRVVRLSDEPGSQSLYFHQNAYTPDGTKLVMGGS